MLIHQLWLWSNWPLKLLSATIERIYSQDSDPMHSHFNSFSLPHDHGRNFFFYFVLVSTLSQFSAPVHADAFRCRSTTGQVVFSNLPCAETHRTTNVVNTENIDESNLRKAQTDLERQKLWLKQREGSQQTYSAPASTTIKRPTGDAYDSDGRDRIHTCLMAVTAKTGLSAYETGQRRVNCYQGTYGLKDECEMRVTGTAGLTSNQENNLRLQCKNLPG